MGTGVNWDLKLDVPRLMSAGVSPSANALTRSSPLSTSLSRFVSTAMGKRKKAQNIVKIDMGDYAIAKGTVLPVLVQQLSKDGRRFEQTVHPVPTPQQHPLPSTFDPSPSVEDAPGYTFHDASEPMDERDGPERVSPSLLPLGHILNRLPLVVRPSADVVHRP